MYKTEYVVSLTPNCFKSSPRSPAPQLSAQIFNCPACSAVRWCREHNLGFLGRGPLGPFSGCGTLAGPCGCRSWVCTCSELCSSGSVLTAGGCRARSLFPLEGCTGIHGSGPLHRQTADRGHSFGCQQDKPSASLVTTDRTSMCIDLQMCLYSCMLFIVFCWE